MLIVAFSLAVVLGIMLGVAIAVTRNTARSEQFVEHVAPLPSKVLDRYDREITTFFGPENRELVTIDQVPQYLIDALITKEDRDFYHHHGYSVRGLVRAFWNIVTGQYVSGASTLTQQLAGQLKHMRNDISIRRKLVEMWDAVQLERRYTKQEILEQYLNEMPFGAGNLGVQAASEYYFGHPVSQDTLAESAMLVIQLSSPSLNNPIRNPDRAKKLQKTTLDDMVKLGYVNRKEADDSFNDYWANYDYTRASASAFLERADKAPYFSEYIRNLVDDLLLGAYDVNTDGLVIHTTLDLDYQKIADERMAKDIDTYNAEYEKLSGNKLAGSNAALLPVIDMLGYTFDIEDLMNRNRNAAGNAKRDYAKRLSPVVEALAALFSIPRSQDIISAGMDSSLAQTRRTQVQGALVSIDPSNGYILAMVGGRKFSRTDQFNRAVSARVPPGSSFKPFYYSAAIDSRAVTAATRLLDAPVKFTNADGTLYEPLNYKGRWVGPVLLRDALANSMNVPSLKVLDRIGFDAAIQRSSRMLGITDPGEMAKRHFDRVYPLGLGEPVAVSPLEMARAYATFDNAGREVVPVAIRYIEDRNGKIIASPAQDMMARESRKGDAAQIMSPQAAYIMTSMLQSTITAGTLVGTADTLDAWNPKATAFAGKTGTTQNWENAWTIGFSPYVVTAVWFGFDQGNRSLGTELTGAAIAGPTWAQYMRDIHKNLPAKRFVRPDSGLVETVVSATSGLLPSEYTKKKRLEIFLAGTEPKTFDTLDEDAQKTFDNIYEAQKNSLQNNLTMPGVGEITIPPLDGGGTTTSPPTNPLLD
jgi:penicillin-binding protein 1A